jgi:flagellar biogenesis protein FliO
MKTKIQLLLISVICFILKKLKYQYTITKKFEDMYLIRNSPSISIGSNPSAKLEIYSNGGRVGIGV